MSIRSSSLILLTTLTAAACTRHSEPAEKTARASAPTTTVRAALINELRSVAGTVRAGTSSTLSAKVIGNVTRVLVREGDRVRAGQILIEIDSREASAQVERAHAGEASLDHALQGAEAGVAAARATADLAAVNLQRFERLNARGSVSRAEYDGAKATASVAAAELERAMRAHDQLVAQRQEARAAAAQASVFLDYSAVRAPADGLVTARFVDPGTQAAPGMPLLTVESESAYRVEATAPEGLAVNVGDEAEIETGGGSYRARVSQVVPSLDPRIRSALVKIELPRDAPVRSGAFARVSFTIGQRRAIAVPRQAVSRHGDVATIFVVDEDNVARVRVVTTGDQRGQSIEVLSGLDEGERIVTDIPAGMRDGVRLS
jgi:multidrug efflux pump subunit AcrA (membrane-fusion protein)